MKSNVAAPRTVLVDNSWMEVSSLDLLLNINHDKVRARVIEVLLLVLNFCEAQGKGRAKGQLRKSIVNCQLSIVNYRYRFP